MAKLSSKEKKKQQQDILKRFGEDISKRAKGVSRKEFITAREQEQKAGKLPIQIKERARQEAIKQAPVKATQPTQQLTPQAQSQADQFISKTFGGPQTTQQMFTPKPQMSTQAKADADAFIAKLQGPQIQQSTPANQFRQSLSAITARQQAQPVQPQEVKPTFRQGISNLLGKSPLVQAVQQKSLRPFGEAIKKQFSGKGFQMDLKGEEASKQGIEFFNTMPFGPQELTMGSGIIKTLVKAKTKEAVLETAKKNALRLSPEVAEQIAKTSSPSEISGMLKVASVSPAVSRPTTSLSSLVGTKAPQPKINKAKVSEIVTGKKVETPIQIPKKLTEGQKAWLEKNPDVKNIDNTPFIPRTIEDFAKDYKTPKEYVSAMKTMEQPNEITQEFYKTHNITNEKQLENKLTEIFNKTKSPSPIQTELIQEAKKYKSAEEFTNELLKKGELNTKYQKELIKIAEEHTPEILSGADPVAVSKKAMSDIWNKANKTIASDKSIGQKEILQQVPSPSVVRKEYTYTEGVPPKEQIVKTSKFAERVSQEVPKPLSEQLVETKYSQSRNIDVLNNVRNVIAQSEDDALKLARTENSVEGNAAATELIGKYLKEGQFEKAASLTKEVSPRFTKQGQQIQILSQYGKLTPEGASRYLQKIVDEANSKLPTNKKISLKGQDLEEVAKQAEKIQGLTEGTRDYAVAVAQLMDKMASKIPATIGQKIATIQTMAQLLNPKTAIRNVVGNVFLGGAENISDVVATGVDKFLGKTLFKGQRSIALPSISAQAKGAKSGFKLGLEDALMGIDTGALGTQFDLPSKTFRGGIMGALEKGLNIELKATDRAFYKAAYDGALDSMKRAAKVEKVTPQMELRAGEEALYRTFQNNSLLAQGLSKFKKGLNKIGTPGGEFGLGDLINKYPKTPGNIVAAGIDYSPFGLIKAANNIVKVARGISDKGIGSQREIAQNIGRAITGTGLIASGYMLAKNGIITGQKEKDYDIQQQYRETGQGPFKLNIDALKRLTEGKDPAPKNGDNLVSYDWLQPNAIQFSMGANMAIGAKGAEDQLNTAIEGLSSGVDTITQQPVIKGVSDFFRTATQTGGAAGIVKGLAGAATNAPASFVPSLFNQIAQLRDNVARNTYSESQVQTSINKVKQRIPGFREDLKPQIGTKGQELEQYQNNTNSIFNVMFNPAFVSKIDKSPDAKMVLDIYEKSGETQQAPRLQDKTIKVNGEDIKLTSDQLEKMQRFTGQTTASIFESLAKDSTFIELSDEEKAKQMSNIMTDIGKLAKVEILGDKGDYKTKDEIVGAIEARKKYQEVQSLLKEGKTKEAQKLIPTNKKELEYYKEAQTSLKSAKTKEIKKKYAEEIDIVADLYKKKKFKEYRDILNSFTAEEQIAISNAALSKLTD